MERPLEKIIIFFMFQKFGTGLSKKLIEQHISSEQHAIVSLAETILGKLLNLSI
jgi:hypothetical protein